LSFAIVEVLQNRLALFTGDVCRTIDDMMQEEATPRVIIAALTYIENKHNRW